MRKVEAKMLDIKVQGKNNIENYDWKKLLIADEANRNFA